MWKLSQDLGRLAHLAAHLDPRATAFQAFYDLSRQVRRALRPPTARVVPTALYIETSSACRGRCRGCYIPVLDRKHPQRLGDEALRGVLRAARKLRPNYICIVGGEPLDPSIIDTNLAMIRDEPGLRFLLCTGGHGRCDPATMETLAAFPNLAVFFSIDGLATTHDRVRGRGNFDRTLQAARSYSRSGRSLSGASVTLRPENWEEVTSPAFLSLLEDLGITFVGFDPWFSEQGASLSSEAMTSVVLRLRAALRRSPLVCFVNPFGRLHDDGFEPEDGWLAASVDYRGNVYGSRRGQPLGNVGDLDLDQILDSDAFQRGYRDLGSGGCSLDDPRRPLFEQTLARLSAPMR